VLTMRFTLLGVILSVIGKRTYDAAEYDRIYKDGLVAKRVGDRKLASADLDSPSVVATFYCTSINGDCFTAESHLEGMPVDHDGCVSEQKLGPLKIAQEVDLDCLKSTVSCDHVMMGIEFDPFSLCNQDRMLLQVTCSLNCHVNPHKGIQTVYETCVYDFDQNGIYNMSFDAISVCHLDSECESPYVDKNVLHCYGLNATRDHDPWEVTQWGGAGRGDVGGRPSFIRTRTEPAGHKSAFWTYLVVLCFGSCIILFTLRCMCKKKSPRYQPANFDSELPSQ